MMTPNLKQIPCLVTMQNHRSEHCATGRTLCEVCLHIFIAYSLGIGCHSKLSGGACCFVCPMDASSEAAVRIHQEQEEEEGKCCVLVQSFTSMCVLILAVFCIFAERVYYYTQQR